MTNRYAPLRRSVNAVIEDHSQKVADMTPDELRELDRTLSGIVTAGALKRASGQIILLLEDEEAEPVILCTPAPTLRIGEEVFRAPALKSADMNHGILARLLGDEHEWCCQMLRLADHLRSIGHPGLVAHLEGRIAELLKPEVEEEQAPAPF